LSQQRGEAVPVGPTLRDPQVGEDWSHGPGQRPEF
jgi:hypothetical protein